MRLTKIKDITDIHIGQGAPQNKTDFSESGNPFIRAGSLESMVNKEKEIKFEFISDEIAKKYKLKLFPTNAVVFAKSGMSATKNRIVKLMQPSYVVNHLVIIQPKKIVPDYLLFALREYKPSILIKDLAYPSIGQKDIENHKIPIPENYDDQIRIATILSRAERLIARRKESIGLLDEFMKSTFLEMFGDPVRNEKGWEKKCIKEIAEVRIGPFGSLLHAEDYVVNKIPLINPSHIIDGKIKPDYKLTITPEKFNKLEPYQLKINDIVVARRGEIGRCAIVRTPELLLCGTGSMFIRIFCNYSPLLLQYQIYNTSLKDYLESKAKGITMKNLNSSTVGNLKVLYPPLPLQEKFASIAQKVEVIKTKYTESLTELENLYGSLSQKAFRGELDLSSVPIEETFSPEPQELKREVPEVDITEKITSEPEFINFIKSLPVKNFSFKELWNELEKSYSDDMPEYEKTKGMIYKLLDNNKLSQSFDTNKKEMVLTLNR